MLRVDSQRRRDEGIPLYVRLGDVLRHRIAQGEWAIGELIPSLEELCIESGLARSTVRRAIGLLIDEGLLRSGRGVGTRVVATPDVNNSELRSTINEVSSADSDFRIEILDRTRNILLPEPLLMAAGTRSDAYALLKKKHLYKGIPFALMHIHVLESVYARFPNGAESRQKIAQLVNDHSPARIERIKQTITVEPADTALTEALDYRFSAPVAKVVRHFLDAAGRLVYCGVFWYRGDGFSMETELPGSWLVENQPAVAPRHTF